MKNFDNDKEEMENLQDDLSFYDDNQPQDEQPKSNSFYENLAENLSDETRKKISAYLLDALEEDIEARRDWLESGEKAKKYLGFSIEDLKDKPFSQATRTFEATLPTSVVRFVATAYPELLPPGGPVGFKINGTVSEEMEKKAELHRDWMNYYLTTEEKGFYPDFERFLLYLVFYGSIFRKVYYDSILKRPISRFIKPEDFVVNGDCTSILESSRITHILHLSKKEILLNQQNKLYLDVELSYLKTGESTDEEEIPANKKKDDIDLTVYTKRSLFPICEFHVDLNLKDFDNSNDESDDKNNIPAPYIITIDKTSKEVLSIRKNWAQDDPEQKRENYFVGYNYFPGYGVYGYGLAHLLGSNAITLTSMLRQLVDAAKYKNLQGGLRVKGLKQQNNDLVIGPGQFVEVDTGGVPLAEAFMPLPYSGADRTLFELMLWMVEQSKVLGSTSELGMLDSKEDIPTGTTLAMLESNNRIQSAVLRSIHVSLSHELQLIDKIFRRTLETESFSFGKSQNVITSDDFLEEVRIIPVSDPSINSTTQKIIKAESMLRTAQIAPELHDMREVLKLNYEAQGLDSEIIDKILKPNPEEGEVIPLDPVSENLNIMKGNPVKAAIWQEHAAHKYVHAVFAQENPDLQAVIMAHIKEHDALEYLLRMQELLGQEMPPLEEIQDPNVQNSIALAISNALEETGAGENQQQQPVDPNALLMADIQQKEAETAARERIANLKAETDVFKTQMDFEKEKAKIESNEDIAKLKAETELAKSQNQTGVY